jgi:protein ImuB
MVVCVHLPRFELAVAAGGGSRVAEHGLRGVSLAIAPAPGGQPRVGEVSSAAEGFGVSRGMALGEALARCPELRLVPGDPLRTARAWEEVAGALEGVGAALELPRPGLAYFAADGLRGLHGGEAGVIAAAGRALRGSERGGVGRGGVGRIGAGPTRFCALAAALGARPRRARVLRGEGEARRHLASCPVDLLAHRAETAALVEPLRRLGMRTLGELAALRPDALADRFGEPGLLARRLALGGDTPLRPRDAAEHLEETLELWESGSGPALERVLGLLVDRLLARPERRGRTLRALVLSARLAAGGTWSERVVLREALSDPRRLRLALVPRLTLLPAPADALSLAAERFGPPEGAQGTLGLDSPDDAHGARLARRVRLGEAVGQARAAAGPGAALRALCVDPDSRVPERRVVLTPFAP